MKKLFFTFSLLLGIIGISLTLSSLYLGSLDSLIRNYGDSYSMGISTFLLFWGIVSITCSWVLYKFSKRS
ncbi:TPA: hypothetical protein DEP94_02205 [Candidatus Nomurabacteria bacterium]|nr:hypothetical protein [Candidatus Nomurabacteria bacterium]